MRTSASFNARRASTLTASRALRSGLHSGPWASLLCAVLVSLIVAGRASAHKHAQGRSLQGTSVPRAGRPWLQGPQLVASLRDGTQVEIARFAGDVVHTIAAHANHRHRATLARSPKMLIGMQWTETRCEGARCVTRRFRVADAARDCSDNTMRDPRYRDNCDVWLYRVEYLASGDPEGGDWVAACRSASGGLFVDGRWRADGTWDPDGYTFSCQRGVVAKCVRVWGYKPWKTLRSGREAVDLQPLHVACSRAARADYCGDGGSYTVDGVIVNFSDRHGFNVPDRDPQFVEESAFSAAGVVRLHHPRVPGRSPFTHPGSRTCAHTGSRLADQPALIYVRSREAPASRVAN